MGNLLKRSNWKKTIYYFKKNGFRQAFYAVLERAFSEIKQEYHFEPLTEAVRLKQEKEGTGFVTKFSILVPTYETKPEFLRAMLDSVLAQTYRNFELILADASKTDDVKSVVQEYQDERIRYHRLAKNEGISGNTNQALLLATGDYVGLLDHDDLLTADALYECASCLAKAEAEHKELRMLYSDEDKCDSTGTSFYEPNDKPDFNLDLILSNNYICHFLVMQRSLLQELAFRSSMDGAQDYDVVLRAVNVMLGDNRHPKQAQELAIAHIPKVLYHWRCYEGSTSENPESKRYAYEAGRRVVEDFLKMRKIQGTVEHTRHLGFYRIVYQPNLLSNRPDVAVIGGKVLNRKNRIIGGIYDSDGKSLYQGLHREYSGTMHRAACQQEAWAVDVRCMVCSAEAQRVLERMIGVPYQSHPSTGRFFYEQCLDEGTDPEVLSLQFCEELRNMGKRIVWDPQMVQRIGER